MTSSSATQTRRSQQVERDVAHDQAVVGVTATLDGAEPGEQLLERERLDQVVVGAGLQAGDPLGTAPGR